jgi:glycosyltransferase involved in cell wall biosynthesis
MRECGGAVVLEAMASGIPVIATNWGGPVDYITDDTGILIPPDTPEKFARELANSILLLATNPELRQKMSEAGRNRAERLYDWRVKARALLELYEAVVTNSEIPETAKI